MIHFIQRVCLITLSALISDSLAKPPIPTPLETPVVGEWDKYFLETLYEEKNQDTGLEKIVEEARFNELVKKHEIKLLGGPMLGCVTQTTARIWVRTPGPAKVQALINDEIKSAVISTSAESDFTALLDLEGLKPATSYQYDITVDEVSALSPEYPGFRTAPSKSDKTILKIGFGGCARYNPPKERMWDTIAGHSLDAFLFLGDNVYIDLPKSRTKQRVHYYRRQLRPEFQRFVSSTSIYAVYDDHDFGVNDSAGGLEPFKPDWKFPSLQVFRENWNNPAYGGGEDHPGCWFNFSIGDIDFFMIDNRYYRSFKNGTMLGPVQKKWFLEKLKASKAKFKILASGTLWTEKADKRGRDSWWGVKEEREEIFSCIEENNIGGVILLSSDRHRCDVYKIKRENSYDLYEFESGNLTNNHIHNTNKKALFSYNEENQFGLLNFDFKKTDPEVTFRCVTINNDVVYELTLPLSQLQNISN